MHELTGEHPPACDCWTCRKNKVCLPPSEPPKFLYLLHFEEKLSHAQHYLGSSEDLIQRLKTHADGWGAAITAHLAEEGRHWVLAGLWTLRDPSWSLRDVERRAKKAHRGNSYCPICMGERCKTPPGTIAYPVPCLTSRTLRSE